MSRRRTGRWSMVGILLLAGASFGAAAGTGADRFVHRRAGLAPWRVERVAATADERAQGLMYREEVPDGTGMLFVFQDSQPRSFWMANTYVPLDIAYMDPSYRVVDIVAMEPLVTESYPSDAPAMFALEVRQGWFAAQGVGVGARANIVFGIQGR